MHDLNPKRQAREYVPVVRLGSGGSADVNLALARGADDFTKLVVLKTLREEYAEDSEYRQAFIEEARLSARLNHPNIVQFYELRQTTACPTLVMEYLEGQPLARVLSVARERFTPESLIALLLPVLQALHYAHELKDVDGSPLCIVHRDIAPENVFVTYDGRVKVLDFGIAKAATSEQKTRLGVIKGRVSHMAPEQLLGGDVDRRTDVFAVGSLLWDLTVGSPLWNGLSEGDIIQALAEGSIPRLRDFVQLDAELEAIIERALAPERDQRYPTALEFHEALSNYLDSRGAPSVSREVGQYLSTLFDDERAARAAAIQVALAAPVSQQTTLEGMSMAPESPDSLSAVRQPTFVPVPPRRARTYQVGVALTAALALALAVVGLGGQGSASTTQPTVEAATAPLSDTVTVHVEAHPERAELWLDGKKLASNPAKLELARSAMDHELRATCEGCVEQIRPLRTDRDRRVTLQLGEARPTSKTVESAPAPQKVSALPRRLTPPPSAPVAAAPRSADCTLPFYFLDGVKVYRPECL
jgi:serine/threonine-protein kinase